MFPLYEVEKGKYKLNYTQDPKPVTEYLKSQGRFRHLSEGEISKIQEKVNRDWAKLKDLASMGAKAA
jgi:pyruvate ferredoxin oxidoreductase beta subunit